MQITEKQLTAKQQFALDDVRDLVLYTDRYEVKDLTLDKSEWDGSVYVQIEIGIKNDEHTMARICRNCYAFSIGKNGGIYYYNKNHNRVYTNRYHLPKLY